MNKAAVTAALASVTLLLAACGEKAGEKAEGAGDIAATDGMSRGEVKAQVDKVQLKPGQWEGSFTLEDIDLSNMPGASPQMKDRMKQMMTQPSIKYCVTPEEAANPSGKMFSGQENKDCTYSGFDARGGAVKGQVSCKGENGTMSAVMTGNYAPENYEMQMNMKMEGGPQGMTMAMKARTTGKWVGATCS
ncbi:DUF3617 domain-containing protein [Sphingobium sp. CFD-1]|uniref:DUF3617 domain-containing protein n=1 Tax=Sphingobium sp. CFD-1 TaxID=2878545 RepID=UPI00214B4475|nr:DUF3617 domain-containing protein [Sphingobium sp. CFD-1]